MGQLYSLSKEGIKLYSDSFFEWLEYIQYILQAMILLASHTFQKREVSRWLASITESIAAIERLRPKSGRISECLSC